MTNRDTRRRAPANGRAARNAVPLPLKRRVTGNVALSLLALAFGGLLFWLSYAAVGEPAVASIMTLLMVLPAAGLAAGPPASRQMRR